jgi:hypothetical protein
MAYRILADENTVTAKLFPALGSLRSPRTSSRRRSITFESSITMSNDSTVSTTSGWEQRTK